MEANGDIPLYIEDLSKVEQYSLDESTLREIAVRFERDTREKEFRRLARRGELESYLSIKIRSTQEYAKNLIEHGEIPDRAWNRAIRVHIMEREED